jgi:hypothetical protein
MSALWIEIIEANLSGLTELHKTLAGVSVTEESRRQLLYCQVMIAYFRHSASDLESLISTHGAWLEHHPDLTALATLRWHIRRGPVDLEAVKAQFSESFETSIPALKGEWSFALAYAHNVGQDFRNAEIYYLAASAQYALAGAGSKSLRAELSALASYSCLHPESRLFPDYTSLYRKAMTAREHQTAAACLVNISREFQRLEALPIAMDYVSQAISLHEVHHEASREHGLCLLHRAHLYLQLERNLEAQRDLFFALSIPHGEVQSSCRVLAEKYGINLQVLPAERVLPTWAERAEDPLRTKPLGKLESQLLLLLSEAPQDKFTLMDTLYGEKIDPASKEGRFKNLLARLRARFPGLIVLENDLYKISDPFVLGALNLERNKIG